MVRLLLLEPGTYQTHPDMGVGLVSKYRYSFNGRADELKADFKSQISKYLPLFQGILIDVKEIDSMYYITATINGQLYGFTVNNKFEINTAYKKLDDLK